MLFIKTNENLKRQGLKRIICLLAIPKANLLHEMEMYIPRKALIHICIDKVIKIQTIKSSGMDSCCVLRFLESSFFLNPSCKTAYNIVSNKRVGCFLGLQDPVWPCCVHLCGFSGGFLLCFFGSSLVKGGSIPDRNGRLSSGHSTRE